LAFILKHRLSGPDCTIVDVVNATDYVVPAIEIIDARIRRIDPSTGATRKVLDTISDNAANAGMVLGGIPVRPEAVDLRWVSALIHRNGVIEDSGVAAAVLGHPALGVAWLANKLAPWGETLGPGEIILSGSFTAPVFASAGDFFHVDYGPLGSVSTRFT
jgi:2-oxo-hept-3-ene-1,7-dioate hydratase